PPPAPETLGLRISRTAEGTPVHSAGAYGSAQAGRGLLDRHILLVKERVAFAKLTDTYDILDPASGQTIGIAKEEPPTWAKLLRLAVGKQSLPTSVNVYEHEGAPAVLSVRRGFTVLRSKINVVAGGRNLGYFKSKLISIGGGFTVFDHKDQQVAEVKGD